MPDPTRRAVLRRLAAGCCAAAAPASTPMLFAATPGENRLVVIILRGAMDGLALAWPGEDRLLAGLRPGLLRHAGNDAIPLDDGFVLHPEFAVARSLIAAGELAVIHAVATPYRDRRSHFDGQDLLETGSPDPVTLSRSLRDGWLNRALPFIAGATGDTALAVGRENMLILRGDHPASSWEPGGAMPLGVQAEVLLHRMYANDPIFAAAAEGALGTIRTIEMAGGAPDDPRQNDRRVRLAGRMLRERARIASFSLGGWDTHAIQAERIRGPMKDLARAIMILREDLGPAWQSTVVLAITEFGRTVRENGSGGTDHGTGGAALIAGGALKGRRLLGRWPGLADDRLYRNRDLMPTEDVRRYAAWALRGLYGIGRDPLERVVFPGLDLGDNPGLLA